MRKFLITIGIMISCAICAQAHENVTITTDLKETIIENGLYVIGESVYMPVENTCESIGAVVYKTADKSEYYIISHDGDIIICRPGTSYYELNGEQIGTPSNFIQNENGELEAPFSMFVNIFNFNVVYDDYGAHIIRNLSNNIYNEHVKNVMRFCFNDNFYPENFSRYLKYYVQHPQTYMGTIINNVNMDLDKHGCRDAVSAANSDSILTLVNKTHKLSENFDAKNLSEVYGRYTKHPKRKFFLNTEAYYKYVDMYDAAEKENCYLKIVSAYRTEEYQKNLYNSYSQNYGTQYAEAYSARPGHSEHQTGFAVDINSLYTTFENSAEYAWLKNNAHKYGFIERYKKGSEHITGYAYEPWHYRYVGVDAATAIHEQNITFEEYHSKYIYKSKYELNKDKTWANVIRYY